MERTTFSVLFFIRRTRLNKHGEAPVEMRITINGTRIDSSLKRTIPPQYWSTAKGQALPKNRACRELNTYIDTVKLRLMTLQRQMELDGESINPKSLLNKFLGNDEVKPTYTILGVFREHNEKCKKLSGIDMSPATVERYETSYKHTAEFIRHAYYVDDLDIDSVDHKFVTDYEFYLKTERRCSHNTTTKYLKNFKKITRIALANEYMKRDPFANIRFSLDEVEREFLEDHELKLLIDKKFTIERLEQIRDIFLVLCFTGLAFSDLKGLREEHIFTDNNGKMWIRKRRQKTNNMCNIPLLDIPLAIFDKYKDHPCRMKGEFVPIPSNQKLNSYIKEIMDLCGIQKDISSHVARHTFSTTVALANGVSMESVAKMLGHSNTNMTRHYAKVLDRTVISEMGKVAERFNYNKIMRNKITISENGSVSVPANVQMADFEIAHLFGVTYSAVRGKIKTLLKSRYISDCSGGVVRGNLIIPEYFGMEVVIAVAFQMDSHEADLFRRWVMKRLTQQPKLSQTIYLDIRDMPNNIFN